MIRNIVPIMAYANPVYLGFKIITDQNSINERVRLGFSVVTCKGRITIEINVSLES